MLTKVQWGNATAIYYEPSGSGGGRGLAPGNVLVMSGTGRGPQFIADDVTSAQRWIEKYDPEHEHILVVVNSTALVCPDTPAHERCGRIHDDAWHCGW